MVAALSKVVVGSVGLADELDMEKEARETKDNTWRMNDGAVS